MKSQGIILKYKKLFIYGLIASTIIIFLGYMIHKMVISSIRENKYDEIKSIAGLKTDQITLWLKERRNEISLVTNSPFFSDAVDQWLEMPVNVELRQDLITRFSSLIKQKDYNEIILFSDQGEPLLFFGKDEHPLCRELIKTVKSAIVSQESIQITDFYRSDISGNIYIDFAAPLFNNDKLLAILVFRVDPEEFLYPLVRSWPTSSQTAETLILTVEKDSVVILNNPSQQSDIALKLKLPLTDTALPVVKAVLGKTGFIEDKDFRGENVLSYLSKIPSSDWFVVVKEHESEIFAEVKALSITLIGVVILLILLAGSIIIVYYNLKQKQIYFDLLQSERNLLESQTKELEKQKDVEKERDYWLRTFNAIKDPIALIDKEGKLIKSNLAFTVKFDLKPDEANCIRCHQLLHNTNDHIPGCPLVKSSKSLQREEMELSFDSHTYLVVADPIINADGVFEGIVHIMNDITVFKHTEEELIFARVKAEESNNLKTIFLHSISHEIRTPMNAIIGFSDLLTQPHVPVQTREEFSETINSSCHQLLKIVNDIVIASSLEAGKVDIDTKDTDINQIMKTLNNLYVRKADSKNLTLNIIDTHHLPELHILTDETKLIEILSNLIGNGIKYTEDGGVQYGYKPDENIITFFVRDTGIGIESQYHNKIFERFYRVIDPESKVISGMGLGLSISKLYCDMLGGKIWLNSEPEKGSEFSVSLPLHYSNAESPIRIDENKLKIRRFKNNPVILIAEDELSNFQLLKIYLDNLGVSIIHAVNGLEAIEKINRNTGISLVLMDIKMPVMDGIQATRQIRNLNYEIPIIAQTAFVKPGDKENALSAGCNDYITKPISKNALLAVLLKYLPGEI